MMAIVTAQELLIAFEMHSPEKIRAVLRDGVDPLIPIGGKSPVTCLVEMYTRSPRFFECLQVLLAAGAALGDPLLEALLLDDQALLQQELAADPEALSRRFWIADSAYTSLRGVSALHICAEFNSTRCADLLLSAGADVNARADIDTNGIGGQTPIYHAVNSNGNYCRPMLELLLNAGASLDIRVPALRWGGGCSWETILCDVTPISYAQCGLLPQFHRKPEDIYANIGLMQEMCYGRVIPAANVPNAYLAQADP